MELDIGGDLQTTCRGLIQMNFDLAMWFLWLWVIPRSADVSTIAGLTTVCYNTFSLLTIFDRCIVAVSLSSTALEPGTPSNIQQSFGSAFNPTASQQTHSLANGAHSMQQAPPTSAYNGQPMGECEQCSRFSTLSSNVECELELPSSPSYSAPSCLHTWFESDRLIAKERQTLRLHLLSPVCP